MRAIDFNEVTYEDEFDCLFSYEDDFATRKVLWLSLPLFYLKYHVFESLAEKDWKLKQWLSARYNNEAVVYLWLVVL